MTRQKLPCCSNRAWKAILYEPTPQDIKLIRNSDLFIYTGGENDVWIEEILSSMGDKKPATLKLLDIVPTVKEEVVKGMEHDHDDGEDELDEHVVDFPQKRHGDCKQHRREDE